MLIDKRDVGRITILIIMDERTLNKRVTVYGEVLSQNEIHAMIEDKTGEKLDSPPVCPHCFLTPVPAANRPTEISSRDL